MNCIIIDDKAGCKLTEEYVSKNSSLQLAGSFNDLSSAIDMIESRKDIDLVFVDVKLTGMESLDLIRNLREPPNIIVISSTEKYAVMAFDYNVVDYLLKPLNYSRFCKAVDKTFRYFQKRKSSVPERKEIFIKKGTALFKLKLKDILLIEGLENYVTLYIGQEKYVIHFTMKAIESQLPSDMFLRVHKSYIVNKNYIKRIKENSLDLALGKESKSIPVGPSFRESLLNQINVMNR
jgi:DNA-binding LytR/AlgR family response regulator